MLLATVSLNSCSSCDDARNDRCQERNVGASLPFTPLSL